MQPYKYLEYFSGPIIYFSVLMRTLLRYRMVVMLLVTMLPGNMGMAAPAAEKLNYPELTYSFYKKKGNFWTADEVSHKLVTSIP